MMLQLYKQLRRTWNLNLSLKCKMVKDRSCRDCLNNYHAFIPMVIFQIFLFPIFIHIELLLLTPELHNALIKN